MDGSVVGKGEGREEIGWNGMGARSQEEERVWVVRERGADIFSAFLRGISWFLALLPINPYQSVGQPLSVSAF